MRPQAASVKISIYKSPAELSVHSVHIFQLCVHISTRIGLVCNAKTLEQCPVWTVFVQLCDFQYTPVLVQYRSPNCTAFRQHFRVKSVHCTMLNVQCSLYSAQCSMHKLQTAEMKWIKDWTAFLISPPIIYNLLFCPCLKELHLKGEGWCWWWGGGGVGFKT